MDEPVNFSLLPAQWHPSEAGQPGQIHNPSNLADYMDADGNPTAAGVYRNVQIWLRTERLIADSQWPPFTPFDSTQTDKQIVPKIQWQFTGRTANGDPQIQLGPLASFSYAAASYSGVDASTGAVPNKGRRFDFNGRQPSSSYDLPAYPVNVFSYCGLWRSIRGQVSERYWHPLTQCFPTYRDENGNWAVPAGHETEGCPAGYIAYGEWRFRWTDMQWQWDPVDMRDLGLPKSYLVNPYSTAGGLFNGTRWWEPRQAGIWVPVVEVQTVQQESGTTP